jgi:Mitochondrial ribosomal protein subunit L20
MRELRNHPDPERRLSRGALAKKFACSQLFVGMAAPLDKVRLKEVRRTEKQEREGWGPRKRFLRETRRKRREEWYLSEE